MANLIKAGYKKESEAPLVSEPCQMVTVFKQHKNRTHRMHSDKNGDSTITVYDQDGREV